MEGSIRRSGGPECPSLKDLSKRFRLCLSDPNYVCPIGSRGISLLESSGGKSRLELQGLARRFGLKFNALRGTAVYLSTEAFYLEILESGEVRLHLLSPQSMETLPEGEDLLEHLQGLMELRPNDWAQLSFLQDYLSSSLGKDFIPRLGGNPPRIKLFPGYESIEIRPFGSYFRLQLKKPLPIAKDILSDLENIVGEGTLIEATDAGELLLNLITSKGPLSIDLLGQRHRYYIAQGMSGVLLSSISFTSHTQIHPILAHLRHQALYNTLLASCGTSESSKTDEPRHVFEVSSLSLDHISVSFEHKDSEGIHALEILNPQLGSLQTRLFTHDPDLRINEDLANQVLSSLHSIPLLMRMILQSPLGSQGAKHPFSNGSSSTYWQR